MLSRISPMNRVGAELFEDDHRGECLDIRISISSSVFDLCFVCFTSYAGMSHVLPKYITIVEGSLNHPSTH